MTGSEILITNEKGSRGQLVVCEVAVFAKLYGKCFAN